MKKIVSAALLATAISTPAFAAEQYYVSLDTGTYSMANARFANPGALDIIGGYRLNDNVAIEAGYMMVGDSTIIYTLGKQTLSQSNLHASAVYNFPVNDSFSLFGKLGFNSLTAKLTGTGSYSTPYSATTTNLTYGVGGEFKLTPQFSANIQYASLGKAKASSTDTGVDVTRLSVGVSYNF